MNFPTRAHTVLPPLSNLSPAQMCAPPPPSSHLVCKVRGQIEEAEGETHRGSPKIHLSPHSTALIALYSFNTISTGKGSAASCHDTSTLLCASSNQRMPFPLPAHASVYCRRDLGEDLHISAHYFIQRCIQALGTLGSGEEAGDRFLRSSIAPKSNCP